MALNLSNRSIFPGHVSEDNIVSPMKIVNGYLVEGIAEKNGDGFFRSRVANREIDDCFNYVRDTADRCCSSDSVSKDIIDLLPSDPFGMDISTTFTAFTGWLEDLEVDYGGYGMNDVGVSEEDYGLFADLNFIWNNTMRFQSFPSNMLFHDKSDTACQIDRRVQQKELFDALNQSIFELFQNEDIANFDDGAPGQHVEESHDGTGCCSDGGEGAPHDAFLLALKYLGVRDLLSVEKVCRSLRTKVCTDNLLWKSFHIDHPLNERITDDVLLHLTARAEGNLQCLSLVQCPRITDDGMKCVLESNPTLTKLCVPGCTRLSIDGIVNSLKALKSNKKKQGIKHLRIGGLLGVTHEHFEELKLLLGADGHVQQNGYKPRFYNRENFYLLCNDDRALDIEICPRCQKLRLVYDCPAEGCQSKDPTKQICRGCTLCISRCIQCGRCIDDVEFEETFFLEFRCSDCFKQTPNCQEGQDGRVCLAKNAVLYEPSSNLCPHG